MNLHPPGDVPGHRRLHPEARAEPAEAEEGREQREEEPLQLGRGQALHGQDVNTPRKS